MAERRRRRSHRTRPDVDRSVVNRFLDRLRQRTQPAAPAATYEFSRLGFRADVIRGLAPDEAFRIVTPVGTFQMTRREFERVFANVVASRSWQERGLYHYPVVPEKATPFLVPSPTTSAGKGR